MKKTSQKGVRSIALMVILDKGNNVSDAGTLDNAWKGAEAYHFLMLCQRQLFLKRLSPLYYPRSGPRVADVVPLMPDVYQDGGVHSFLSFFFPF